MHKLHYKRDFESPGTHVCAGYGIDHIDYPEGIDGCVRVHPTLLGHLFEPLEDRPGTRLIWVYINDYKGNIP